jgi:hypothetical protein
MRPEVIFAIRNARGLDANEKSILLVVESRGVAFGTAETIAADCGMGDNRFYKWRRRLIERGLLDATERVGTTTKYRVNSTGVAELVPPPQSVGLPDTGSPHNGGGDLPVSGRRDSPDQGVKVEPRSRTPQVEPTQDNLAEVKLPDVWAIATARLMEEKRSTGQAVRL